MDLSLIKEIIITILLGFLIGLERNISFNNSTKGFAGSRTFALISLLGFLSSFLTKKYEYFIYMSFFALILISSIAYFLKVYKYYKSGSTTNIAAILSFLVGVLVENNYLNIAITITIFVVIILHLKTNIEKIEHKLSSKDINAALLLLIMSFLILPYLPDKMVFYVNPYKTWLMAIIIASLSFLGYLGVKLIGEKYGILLTGAAGGFVSSTAVSFSLTKLFNIAKANSVYIYAAGIAIANSIMFARVFVESFLIHKELALKLSIPFLITSIVGILYSYYLYKKSKNKELNFELNQTNPLELQEAIKFAIIFAIIYSTTYYLGNRFGNTGVYIISLISGLTDVDAITLSLSSLSKNEIAIKTAIIGISIASLSNSLFKLSIVLFFGKKILKKEILKFFLLIFSVFLISLFIVI